MNECKTLNKVRFLPQGIQINLKNDLKILKDNNIFRVSNEKKPFHPDIYFFFFFFFGLELKIKMLCKIFFSYDFNIFH